MSLSRTLHLLPRSTIVARRSFSTTAPAFVKAGDPVPDIDLVEGSPGNKVNLSKELQGKGLIVGVPAAFSTYIGYHLLHNWRFCYISFQTALVRLHLQLLSPTPAMLLPQLACTM